MPIAHEEAAFTPARRLAGLALSEIVQISEAAAALKREGRDIVSLATGEPDFPTPPHVIEAAHAAALAGQTKYPPTAGLPALRAAIAERAPGPDCAAAQVVVSTGAKQVIASALLATLDPGDEVIIPTPYWTSYSDMVAMAGGTARLIPCGIEAGFKPSAAQIEAAITPRTRWLMLNSPSNPSGAVCSAAELRALAEVLARHPRVWVMSDEIYDQLAFVPFASFRAVAPELAERMLVVNGVSKAHSMTGWRIGWGIGPQPLIGAMTTAQGQITSGACTIAQAAALTALTGPQQHLAERRAAMQARRDRVVVALSSIDGLDCPMPEGAFYAFPSCRGVLGRQTPAGEVLGDDAALCQYLLREHGVALVPGRAFGMPGHFRLSFAYSDTELDAGLARIAQGIAALRKGGA